jgi:hypothetical protein
VAQSAFGGHRLASAADLVGGGGLLAAVQDAIGELA